MLTSKMETSVGGRHILRWLAIPPAGEYGIEIAAFRPDLLAAKRYTAVVLILPIGLAARVG